MALKTITIETRTCDICGEEIKTSHYLNQFVKLGDTNNSTFTIEIRDIKRNGSVIHHPDLCPVCARKMLKKLMESLPCPQKVVDK